MRTHTTTTDVCKFEELSPEMQELAIGKNCDINTDYEWWEFCYDMIKEQADFFGIDTEQDGFCFRVDYVREFGMTARLSFWDLRKALKGKPEPGYKAQEELFSLFGAWYKDAAKKVCPQTWKALDNCNPYATSETRNTNASFDTEADNYDQCDRVANDLQILADLCKNVLQHICHFAAKSLAEELEYKTSDEAIRGTLICNEYEFEADGDGSIF